MELDRAQREEALLLDAALRAGIAREHVHVERFGVPSSSLPAPIDDTEAAQARIGIVIDGVRREIDFRPGQHSILDAGRAAAAPCSASKIPEPG